MLSYAMLSYAKLCQRRGKTGEEKRQRGDGARGGASLPAAAARALREDGALMEVEEGGGFMEEGLLTVAMTGGHSAHAAAGCCRRGQAPT